jgi:hypothetical protein
MTSEVYVDGRSWRPAMLRSPIATRAGAATARAVESEDHWDRRLAPKSQLNRLVKAMVCEFRADAGGRLRPWCGVAGVIQPSTLAPDHGLTPIWEDNSPDGSGGRQTGRLRMHNKRTSPYHHPRIPPLTSQ